MRVRKTKRLLSGLLAVLFVLFSLPLSALAEEFTPPSATKVEVENVTIIAGTSGYETTDYDPQTGGETAPYFRYNYWPSVTVTLTDGTVLEGEGSVEYEDRWYGLETSDNQSAATPWGVGVHTVTASILGAETTFTVEIVESPVAKVEVEDITIIEGMSGYETTDYDPNTGGETAPYFRYDYSPSITVTLTDGTILTGTYGVDYKGEYYSLDKDDGQSVATPWGVGVHTVEAEIMGAETTFTVEIVESPVAKMEIEDVTIIEGTNGYETTDYDSETGESAPYYRYNYSPTVTVTLTDGTVLEGNGSVEYEGEWYYPDYEDSQSAATPWGVGTHTVTASVLGAGTTFTVEIVESPVEKVEVEGVTIIEGTSGYETTDYDSETGEYIPYFRYNYYPSFTVTLTDGRVLEGKGRVEYEGEGYYPDYEDGQSAATPWGVGVHTVTASILGAKTTFTVEVSPSPVAELRVENVTIIEGTNGYETTGYDPETGEEISYYHYDYSPTVTLTLTDGSVKNLTDANGVEYDGEWYYLSYDDGQSGETPWGVGVHTATASILGVETTFTVEIAAAPTEKDGFEYISSAAGLMITGCRDTDSGTVTIPAQIDGKPVTGLLSLGGAAKTALHVVLPDSVTTVGESAFFGASRLQTVTVGSGVRYLDLNMFRYCSSLAAITLAKDNPYYTDIDGVVYNKAGDTLVAYPLGKGDAYTLPAGVENIDVLLDNALYDFLSITAAPGSTAFVTEDGVTYDAGKTKVIFCNRGKTGAYDMPDTVTQIVDRAFEGCTQLTSVAVSENVTDIVYSAFAGCTSLAEVSMPENLQSIEGWAFSGCTVLDGVHLPDSLEQIGNSAFSFSGLTDIAIPDRVEKLGPYAFENCGRLKSAALSGGLTSLSYGLFNDCKSLESIAVPQKVTSIGSLAFYDCSSLQSVTLPEGLASIGGAAFAGCASLAGIDLPTSLTDIGDSAFARCTALASITIPDSVTSIGSYVFSGCTSLQSATLPEGLTRISYGMFSGCTSLTDITLPDSVTSIWDSAFYGCTSLTELAIPDSVTYIGNDAFRNCPLKEVTLHQGMTSTGGGYAFSGTAITSLTLPESVTTITYGAFYNCANLLEIDIPESVVSVGNDAFDGTAWYATQPDGPVYLEHVFYNYKGNMPDGTALELKDGTTVVADFALENQSGLKSLALPEGLKTLGFYSLYNCSSLTELYIPASVTRIDDFAFAGCSSLASIEVAPDNLYYKSIDGVLFSKDGSTLLWCPKQETDRYDLPPEVKQISADAFDESGVSILRAEEPVVLDRDSVECRIYGPYTDEEGVYYRIGYKRNELKLESPDSGVSLTTTEDVLEPGTQLVVEPKEVESLVIVGADNYRLDTAVAFDISLENAGQTVQPNGTVTVSIPVPEGLNGKRCRVLYIAENGTITDMKAVYENGCLVFDTTHFSSYMVAEAEVIYGDVTGEGDVTATDALNVLQHVTEKIKLEGTALQAADVDGQNGITASDALQILQFATRKIDLFPVEG